MEDKKEKSKYRMNLYIDPVSARAVKIFAAKQGKKMNQIVIEAIHNYINQDVIIEAKKILDERNTARG